VSVAASGLHLLDADEREHLRKLVDAHGLNTVVNLLEVSRGVISSALAGVGVRRGSLALLRSALAAQRGVSK